MKFGFGVQAAAAANVTYIRKTFEAQTASDRIGSLKNTLTTVQVGEREEG